MGRSKETRWKKLFVDFISHLRIDSKEAPAVDENGSPLEMWGSQRRFLEELCDGLEIGQRTFVCLKARQLGQSTISLAMVIFWALIHPGTMGAIVVDTETNQKVFRATLERYVKNLPAELVGKNFKLKKSNDNFMLFPNGSRIDYLIAGTKTKATWGESRGYSLVLATEVANYGNPAGLASFRETLAEHNENRLFIYESTAKGFNHWKEMWHEAERDTDTRRAIFIGWWAKELNAIPKTDRRFDTYGSDNPDKRETELIDAVFHRFGHMVTREQLAWYRWRSSDASVSDQDRRQNLPWLPEMAFVDTGFSFFQTRLINQDLAACTAPENGELYQYHGYKYVLSNDFLAMKLEWIDDPARISEVTLRIYVEPHPNGQYVIGCDPAYGRTDWKDRQAISVYRCYADRLVQVAEYADSEIESHQCAWILAHLAGAYKNCIVNIDMAGGPGRAVMREFDNLKQRLNTDDVLRGRVADGPWDDALQRARWYLYQRPDSMGAGYCYNFMTTRDSKFDLMNRIRAYYTQRILFIRSRKCLEEMLCITQDGSTIGAPGREKDDRVFASALAVYAYDSWIRQPLLAENATYALVAGREEGEISNTTQVVDRLVSSYFKRAEAEHADPRAHIPKWQIDRGLV